MTRQTKQQRLIISFLVILSSLSSWGQLRIDWRQFSYSHLDMRDGLSGTRIYSIVEGSDGAIWIGTKRGIDRYNGVEVTNYQLTPTSRASDASERSIRVVKVPSGCLYAYDNKGKISVYNPLFDRFELCHDLASVLHGGAIVNTLYISADGTLWVGLHDGLYLLPPRGKGRWVMRGGAVNAICSVGQRLAVATDGGLLFVNPVSGHQHTLLADMSVQSLYADKAGRLWAGTFRDGVKVVDIHTLSVLHRPFLSTPACLPQLPVRTIARTPDGTMLFGIDGAGVYAARADGSTARLLFGSDDEAGNAIHGNGIYAVTVDCRGNIWIGSYTGGIDIAFPSGQLVEVVSHRPQVVQSLINDDVNDVFESSDGRLWYATDCGVSIFDPRSRRWRHALYGKVALTLCQGDGSAVLVGTYGNGVFTVSPDGSSRQLYSLARGVLKTDYVFCLKRDADGDLWIGCLNGHLAHIDTRSGRTDYYPVQQVQTIVGAPGGRVAVGTSYGFFLIDKCSRRVQRHFTQDDFPPDTDQNYFVLSLLFADKARVWVGTDGGGLYLYDMHTRRVKNITTAHGLPSNTVCALGRDHKGRIVASTDQGLALVGDDGRYVVDANYVRGLRREYKGKSMTALCNGRFVVGSSTGAVIISPEQLNRLSYRATLRVRSVEVSGADISLRPRLYKMLNRGEVKLAHNQRTFDISFESICYKYQGDIVYLYQLEGFDHRWSEPSPTQHVRYTNLPPGSYRFHVRAISRNDRRMLDERSVAVSVAQPWWNSLWARIIYLLLLGAVGYAGWFYYKNRLQRLYFNEKINFFVNTAHDIRTPLSLVLAPLDDLAGDPSLSERARSYLEIARSNGSRLLKMITQLLDFQKSDQSEAAMTVHPFELSTLLKAQMKKFGVLAEQKGVRLRLAECPTDQLLWLNADMADKIFENIISNAVKYTPEGGNIELSAHADDRYIYIKVDDTGIGIPREARKHIFRNFYRADNAMNSQQTGSGLGLMLTRRLVEKHRGHLTFNSVEGVGTSFMITFRKGNAHLAKFVSDPTPVSPQPNVVVGELSSAPPMAEEEGQDRDTLLFVDDNDELRHYIRMSFGNHYRVVDVGSAEEALDYLKKEVCDIVVSDVMMPGMSGCELCHRIKENEEMAWLPVILLTAKSGRDFMIEGLGLGADDYVTKPFDTVVLRSKIESMLQNRRRLSRYYLSRSLQLVNPSASPIVAVSSPTPAIKGRDSAIDGSALNVTDREFVDKATHIVMANIADTDFNIDRLCAEMAMSRTLFYGRLKALTGKAPQDFIRLIRLERAALLIKEGKPVLDVSVMTGFVNVKYFSTVFKKHFGVPPSKYR